MRARMSFLLLLAVMLFLPAAAEPPAAPPPYMPLSGPPLHYAIEETTNTELPGVGPVQTVDRLQQVSAFRAATKEEMAEVGAGPAQLVVDISRRDGVGTDPAQEILTYMSASAEGILVHAVKGPDGRLEKYMPPLRHLPRDPAAGATWEMGTIRQQGLLFPTTGSVIGLERVTTMAGVFDSCLHVRFTVEKVGGEAAADGTSMHVKQGTSRIDDWYAPGVGLVREEATSSITVESSGQSTTLSIRQIQELKKAPS